MNADLVEPGVMIQSIHPNKLNALRESYASINDSHASVGESSSKIPAATN